MPAQAGIQGTKPAEMDLLDPGLRRDDEIQ